MSVTEEIKQRADIIEVIGQHTKLTKAGKTFRGLCPFHSEKNPSFFVYPDRQSWHCFGACNTGGDVFSFVMKKEGVGFGEALRLLATRAGVALPARPDLDKKENDRLYQANAAAADYFHETLNSPAGQKPREYLAQRGLLPKTMADFKLGFSLNSWDALTHYLTENGYTTDELIGGGLAVQAESGQTHDRFRNKLMFPIFDIRGRITGFGARVLDDSLPKYINSPQTPIFDKSASLYGINLAQAAIRQQDRAVIVEGYMDVLTAHQNGFPNVIAPMGTSLTEKHINTLKKLTKNVILALDSDKAGEEATLRGAGYENMLEAEVRVILLPQGKDPDDVIREDPALWRRLLEEAAPVIDFTFKMATAGLDLSKARDKSAAVDKLLPVVAEIRDPVRRDHYMQELARLVKVNLGSVETALGRLKSKRRRPPAGGEQGGLRNIQPLLSSPLEEYTLALLLQHPKLKPRASEIPSEHFENTENREIFLAYCRAEGIESIREIIDSSIHEYLDSLLTRSLPSSQLEQKLDNCILRIRENYLRSLETKKGALLALEAETRGSEAELAKLEEQGIDSSLQLGEVFRERGGKGKGGKK